MTIELLYVPGCPNVALARQRIAEAAAQAGVSPDVTEREVREEDQAVALGMLGSPTVLVDGRPVASGPDAAPSVSCRTYRTHAGYDGAPPVGDLVAALRR